MQFTKFLPWYSNVLELCSYLLVNSSQQNYCFMYEPGQKRIQLAREDSQLIFAHMKPCAKVAILLMCKISPFFSVKGLMGLAMVQKAPRQDLHYSVIVCQPVSTLGVGVEFMSKETVDQKEAFCKS